MYCSLVCRTEGEKIMGKQNKQYDAHFKQDRILGAIMDHRG